MYYYILPIVIETYVCFINDGLMSYMSFYTMLKSNGVYTVLNFLALNNIYI